MSRSVQLLPPVEIDAENGSWSVHGQPMVLIPRHFLAYIQMELEKEVGIERAMRIVERSAYLAARTWCDRSAAIHGHKGIEIISHYLEQVGKRGLGRYEILAADPESGAARIRLHGSVYSAEYGNSTGRKTCYMCAASCRGGMEMVVESLGRKATLEAQEILCASEGSEFCEFEIRPIDTAD